jgi:hypothetical protein
MDILKQYIDRYRQLFAIIMREPTGSSARWHSQEAKDIREEMDKLFSRFPGKKDKDKEAWLQPHLQPIAWKLYEDAIQ